MRIQLVSTTDAGGGAQEIGMRLLTGVRRRGHEASMAVGRRLTDDPEVHRIPNAELRPAPARLLRAAGEAVARRSPAHARLPERLELVGQPRRAARLLRGEEDVDFPGTRRLLDLPRHPPQLVHAHNLHGGYFDLRELPAISRRVPLVATLHDAWLLTGHCAHSLECEGWRRGCGGCPHLDVYPAVPRDATALNFRRKRAIYAQTRMDVVTPCSWLRDRVAVSMLATATVETHVIPNGVDLGTFAPGDRAAARAALGLPADADILVFVAARPRTDLFKDFTTLEAAVARLAERPRPLVCLTVGEAGPARRFGDAELRMIDRVDGADVLAGHYRAADLAVHAARADTFPTTVLEALACGTPVVASAVGGIPEQIDDGQTGSVVAPGDPAALAEAIDRWLADPARRAAAGERARADAVRRFDAERMVDEYVALYRRLIDRGVRAAMNDDSSAIRSA